MPGRGPPASPLWLDGGGVLQLVSVEESRGPCADGGVHAILLFQHYYRIARLQDSRWMGVLWCGVGWVAWQRPAPGIWRRVEHYYRSP